jgi:predicted kinase
MPSTIEVIQKIRRMSHQSAADPAALDPGSRAAEVEASVAGAGGVGSGMIAVMTAKGYRTGGIGCRPCIMTAMDRIELPAGALVVLVGVAGSGKSTFAARHFRPTQVLSSDAFRAIVADDEADQRASRAAFELLYLAARRRLEGGRLTVVDATNVTRSARVALVSLAAAAGRPAVAIVFDPPLDVCLDRNAGRSGRIVEPDIVERQAGELRRWLDRPDGLAVEGFAAIYRLADPTGSAEVTIVRAARRATGVGRPGTIPGTRVRRADEGRTVR